MNIRITLDVPTKYLPTLERSLSTSGLEIRPYIKNGQPRWQLDSRIFGNRRPSIPETLVAAAPQEAE